jgi:hypothetical protein
MKLKFLSKAREGIGVRLHNFTKCKTKMEEENVKL